MKSSLNAWIIGCAITGGVLLLLAVFGLIAAVALPNFIQVKGKAREAEVKQNLHEIQLALERYAVDNEGLYPAYLIGGSASFALNIDSKPDGDNWYKGTSMVPVENFSQISDPLIRNSYLGAYPTNPFTRNGGAIQQMQQDIKSVAPGGGDPLRSGAEGNEYGTRFGADCTRMGNVFADPRYRRWDPATQRAGLDGPNATWADIEYRFWDMWATDTPKPFLPGQFWYKSDGSPHSALFSNSEVEPVVYVEIDVYVLAALGSLRTKGQDVVGDEIAAQYRKDMGPYTPAKLVHYWPWTRSKVSSNPHDRGGSPFASEKGSFDLWTGNANGVPDGVVLLLDGGYPTPPPDTFGGSPLPSEYEGTSFSSEYRKYGL